MTITLQWLNSLALSFHVYNCIFSMRSVALKKKTNVQSAFKILTKPLTTANVCYQIK